MSKEQQNKSQGAVVERKDIQLTASQTFTNSLVLKLEKGNQEIGEQFTEYGKRCVINAIAGLLTVCKQQNIPTQSLDPTLLQLQLQNIGFTELNYASSPAEIYFDLRKNSVTTEDGTKTIKYSVTIKPQGAGNEKLVRKFGMNVKELYPAWLIREGDEYTLGSFENDKYTPPSYKPKSLSGKVIMVVYKVRKTDGTFEYLMADRESVKQNLIAQIRQNTMYEFKEEHTNSKGAKYEKVDTDKRDKFYEELDADFEGKTLDECLKMEKYKSYINPTYTSGGSMESMVIRKMKNNALKNYPKEYDTSIAAEAAQRMWEENDETVLEKPKAARRDVVDIVEAQIEETNEETPQDFEVDEDGVVHQKEEIKEETPESQPTNNQETPQEEEKPQEETEEEFDPEANF